MRIKLYRFRDEMWKERAIGFMKFLRHKETLKIRAIMRQEKTLKTMAHFYRKEIHAIINSARDSLLRLVGSGRRR